MVCEFESEDITAVMAVISEQAKREERIRVTIERRSDGFHLSMHSFQMEEPAIYEIPGALVYAGGARRA